MIRDTKSVRATTSPNHARDTCRWMNISPDAGCRRLDGTRVHAKTWGAVALGRWILVLLVPTRRSVSQHMTEETSPMKAIVVTDQAAGIAGMTLMERPEPPAAINDVI